MSEKPLSEIVKNLSPDQIKLAGLDRGITIRNVEPSQRFQEQEAIDYELKQRKEYYQKYDKNDICTFSDGKSPNDYKRMSLEFENRKGSIAAQCCNVCYRPFPKDRQHICNLNTQQLSKLVEDLLFRVQELEDMKHE